MGIIERKEIRSREKKVHDDMWIERRSQLRIHEEITPNKMIVIFTVFRLNDSFARIGCTLDFRYKSVGSYPKRSISYCKSYVFTGLIVIFIFVYFLKMCVANKCVHRLWQISILNVGLNKIFFLNKRWYFNHFSLYIFKMSCIISCF